MNFYNIDRENLCGQGKLKLKKLGDSGEVFYELALRMISEIERNNEIGKHTTMIVPVGPVGQYAIFVRLVNEKKLSLKNTYFINMDEYLNDDDSYISKENGLSFRAFMDKNVYSKISGELIMDESHRIFPDPENPGRITELIESLGGVDLCVGGIGINGHLAFNEPILEMNSEEFKNLPTRVVDISRETRTINAAGELSGAVEMMPKRAVTVGMREILNSRAILVCAFRDWHRAVVRRTLYGDIGPEFPASFLREHENAELLINSNAANKAY